MEAVIKAEPQPQRNPQANLQKQMNAPPPPPALMQQQPIIDPPDNQGPTPMKVEQNFNQGGQQNRRNNQQGGGGGGGGGLGGGNRMGNGGGGNMNRGQRGPGAGGQGGGGNNRFGNRGMGGGGGGGGPGMGGGRQNNFQNRNKDGGDGGDNRDNRDRMQLKGGPNRNMRNGGNEEFQIYQKLNQFQGPTHDLPSIKYEEIKFSGRNRLYIGNLTNDTTEEELKELFKNFGEINEVFLNAEKFFAFVKIDYRSNAEKAKRELDGFLRKNRALRVRFAPNATAIRVKNLTPFVTNELLHKAFEIFGQIEKAVIIVDDRGKPIGEGIVEYTRKSGAMSAIRYCTEKCFFLTSSLRPCIVEIFEHSDDADGYPEKSLGKKNQDFFQARSVGPRFAELKSFEHEYGTRWKQLHELFKQKQEALKNEMRLEEEKLEAQMEYARYEHETEMLRDQLRMREQDREQRKSQWEMKEKYADEQRLKSEEQLRRTQEEMALRMGQQEDELRRRQQENSLFMQTHQLNSVMDQQDDQFNNAGGGNMRKMFDGQNRNQGIEDSMLDFGQNNRVGGGGGGGGGGNMGGNRGNPRGQWINNNQHNDGGFQNKRRRF